MNAYEILREEEVLLEKLDTFLDSGKEESGMMEDEKILLSATQAMKILGIGRNTMYENLLRREDFPAFRIGTKYFINRKKLQNWADKQCPVN